MDEYEKTWGRRWGSKIIEILADEQRKYYPANLVLVEPGVVIMPKGAVKTIRAVEQARRESNTF